MGRNSDIVIFAVFAVVYTAIGLTCLILLEWLSNKCLVLGSSGTFTAILNSDLSGLAAVLSFLILIVVATGLLQLFLSLRAVAAQRRQRKLILDALAKAGDKLAPDNLTVEQLLQRLAAPLKDDSDARR